MKPLLGGISGAFLLAAAAVQGANLANVNSSSIYRSLFTPHSNSTPVFQNITGLTVNPLVKALQPVHGQRLIRRQSNGLPEGTCAPGTPCYNGACCSKTGICGYSPAECGVDTCISNCDAKAECGEYGVVGKNSCPLNVCCSKFGFCGTTSEFCDAGCQERYGGCGAVKEPSCSGISATQRTIGYYEAWSSTRKCDKRLPSDIDVMPFTHLNFAFVYFHPTTFEIVPMSAEDVRLYPQFTALKKVKPGLQTWISVGGWSFNDATNSPNTQTAFSNMAGSAANRQTFIKSLMSFMQTWGFDGADLDWEYPGADDRGGIGADTANYVTLVKEMKAAFGSRYGLSVTLPASYWYLRWFDLKGMEANVDFLNVMTYDIHGVWDSTNKFTGPYVRPHTNLTEIRDSLGLFWRSNVDPSKLTMGIGWYGRSFTLKDPNCNTPGCVFQEGGAPGECTDSSGTLSNAEIQRLISSNRLTPIYDAKAAVKWISWGKNQWVSYDDGESMEAKLKFANELCLGGTLVWAVDQDGSDHISSNNLLGIGHSNGVSSQDAQLYRHTLTNGHQAAAKRNSCYWSFCGEQCIAGYFAQTYAKGQVVGIDRDSSCRAEEYKTLCCAPGTNAGTCSWHGFRGVGLSCASNYCPNGTDLIATNTNQYEWSEEVENYKDWTCNGGSQSYCCAGFVPSPYTSTDNLNLIGQDQVQGLQERNIQKRQNSFVNSLCKNASPKQGIDLIVGLSGGLYLFTPDVGTWVGSILDKLYTCLEADMEAAHEQSAGIVANLGLGALGPEGAAEFGAMSHPPVDFIEVPKTLVNAKGGWQRAVYGKKDKDCSVTYICRYGQGFDEVCDNQRWGIDKVMGGKTVYHYEKRGGLTYKDQWGLLFRNNAYKNLAQPRLSNGRYRCEVDEFPLGSLLENKEQALRLINGPANGAQGDDWSAWLRLIYKPCSSLRAVRGITPAGPPITWKFGVLSDGDPRKSAQIDGGHFIRRYGFDSQTLGSLCWATYTYDANGITVTRTVSDHGFRVHPADPLFREPYNWPKQDYASPPVYPDHLPDSIVSANWLKRQIAYSVLNHDLPLSAVHQAEALAEDLERLYKAPHPEPTDASAFSKPMEATTMQRSNAQHEQPQETERPRKKTNLLADRKHNGSQHFGHHGHR